MANIHIGKKIEKVLRDTDIGIAEFGKRIGVTRNIVYNIFDRESIQTEQLLKISKELKHDFFKYYSHLIKTN